MTLRADVFVSVVAVLRSQVGYLPAFVEEVTTLLAAHYSNYELILVDNGSRGDTSRLIGTVLRHSRCVRYLRLSRRMKGETATVAGLDAAIGDYVVTMHPEFDPPEEIPIMVDRCRSGTDLIVGSAPYPSSPGIWYRSLRWGVHRVARWVFKCEPIHQGTGFRVLSRGAVNALTRVRQRRRVFHLIASDIGLSVSMHHYRFIARCGKYPRANLRRSIRSNVSMALNHSLAPLRLVSFMGLSGSLASLGYSLYVVWIYFSKPGRDARLDNIEPANEWAVLSRIRDPDPAR